MKRIVKAKSDKRSLVVRVEHIRVLTSDELARAAGGNQPTGTSDGCGTHSNQVQTC